VPLRELRNASAVGRNKRSALRRSVAHEDTATIQHETAGISLAEKARLGKDGHRRRRLVLDGAEHGATLVGRSCHRPASDAWSFLDDAWSRQGLTPVTDTISLRDDHLLCQPSQMARPARYPIYGLRFANALKSGIAGSELLVFEGCAHAAFYESVAEFNEKTLSFLRRHTG